MFLTQETPSSSVAHEPIKHTLEACPRARTPSCFCLGALILCRCCSANDAGMGHTRYTLPFGVEVHHQWDKFSGVSALCSRAPLLAGRNVMANYYSPSQIFGLRPLVPCATLLVFKPSALHQHSATASVSFNIILRRSATRLVYPIEGNAVDEKNIYGCC